MKFTKWLAVLGVATLPVMPTGCGGAPFTEAPGITDDSPVAEGGAGTPDAAPTSPQDALSDAGGQDGQDGGPDAPPGQTEASVTCRRCTPLTGSSITCDGTCTGNCVGLCVTVDGTGIPSAGVCTGRCSGECDSECLSPTPFSCTGACS